MKRWNAGQIIAFIAIAALSMYAVHYVTAIAEHVRTYNNAHMWIMFMRVLVMSGILAITLVTAIAGGPGWWNNRSTSSRQVIICTLVYPLLNAIYMAFLTGRLKGILEFGADITLAFLFFSAVDIRKEFRTATR